MEELELFISTSHVINLKLSYPMGNIEAWTGNFIGGKTPKD